MPPDRAAEPAQPLFLVDRSLGRKHVVQALRTAGLVVEALDDHFPQDAADVEWLQDAGSRGWIVLTKDQRIWRNSYERERALRANVRMFILTRQDLRADEMTAILIDAIPGMLRRIATRAAPFAYTISRKGQFTRLT